MVETKEIEYKSLVLQKLIQSLNRKDINRLEIILVEKE